MTSCSNVAILTCKLWFNQFFGVGLCEVLYPQSLCKMVMNMPLFWRSSRNKRSISPNVLNSIRLRFQTGNGGIYIHLALLDTRHLWLNIGSQSSSWGPLTKCLPVQIPRRHQCYKNLFKQKITSCIHVVSPDSGRVSPPCLETANHQHFEICMHTECLLAHWRCWVSELGIKWKTCFDTWWYWGCWVRAILIQKVDARPCGADRIIAVCSFFKPLHFFMLQLYVCWGCFVLLTTLCLCTGQVLGSQTTWLRFGKHVLA